MDVNPLELLLLEDAVRNYSFVVRDDVVISIVVFNFEILEHHTFLIKLGKVKLRLLSGLKQTQESEVGNQRTLSFQSF